MLRALKLFTVLYGRRQRYGTIDQVLLIWKAQVWQEEGED